MSLREQAKQILRMCGHAFVLTVHERLERVERQIDDLSAQLEKLAEAQEALLQASIYLVEDHQRRQTSIGPPAAAPAVGSDGRLQGSTDAAGPSANALQSALAGMQEELRRLRHSVDSLTS